MKRINKNGINFQSVDRVKIVSSTVTLATLLTGCFTSCDNNLKADTVSVPSTETVESVYDTTTSETTVETLTEPTERTIATSIYHCPVEYGYDLADGFFTYLKQKYGDHGSDDMTMFGFDNKYLNESLREYLLQAYGIDDPNITIDNVHYLQFCKINFCGMPYNGIKQLINKFYNNQKLDVLSRAVLIEQGLRFYIDEIPASYFEERFPEFYENYGNADCRHQYQERINYILANYIDKYVFDINAYNSLNDYDRDLILFWQLKNYNNYRNTMLYAPEIAQVRDQETGHHVLVFENYQLARFKNILDDYEGLPQDPEVVEDREHYYEAFGFYPEDVVNNDRVYEGNRSQERSR